MPKKKSRNFLTKVPLFFLFPFKVQFFVKKQEELGTPRVLFSVSKKKIRKAVDRNFIKRRMKEAYRLNKQLLSALDNNGVVLGLIYVGPIGMGFHDIQAKIIQILNRLVKVLNANLSDIE